MSAVLILSFVLAFAGCAGIILAGQGKWYGWGIGVAIQPVWFLFGILTKGYGLCLISIMYGAVYGKNLLDWYRAREVKV